MAERIAAFVTSNKELISNDGQESRYRHDEEKRDSEDLKNTEKEFGAHGGTRMESQLLLWGNHPGYQVGVIML